MGDTNPKQAKKPTKAKKAPTPVPRGAPAPQPKA